jgi:hypothetical protein
MSGKHAREQKAPASATHERRRSGAFRLVRRGLVELATVLVLGVGLPLAAFLTLPHFFDAGTAMEHAPTCAAGANDVRDCLVARPAVVSRRVNGAVAQTWSFTLDSPTDARGRNVSSDGADVELSFPRMGTNVPPGATVHVLFWRGDAVAFTRPDGRVVESLDWGRLYTVSFRILVLIPVWAVTAAILARLVVRRRRSSTALVLGILALGAVAAAPGAWLGLELFGLRGLVTGGVAPLGLGLILSGLALARRRRKARRPVAVPGSHVRVEIPAQRATSGDVDDQVSADR